jgi:hypothetical protein
MNETDKLCVSAATNGSPTIVPKLRRLLTHTWFLKISAGLLFGLDALAAGYYSTRDHVRLGVIDCGIITNEAAPQTNEACIGFSSIEKARVDRRGLLTQPQ